MMFSQLVVGYPSLHQRRAVVLDRRVIARSPIVLTPFSDAWDIEAKPLQELMESTLNETALRREDVDTGAVIITGEAARRQNAQRVAKLFADEMGRFVCVTAGPTLEAIMAAHGSGAVLRSRNDGSTLLNIDIGGGTTKISVVEKGCVRATTAINLGARLIAYDRCGNVIRLEKGARPFLDDIGVHLSVGTEMSEQVRSRLAVRMAQVLFDALTGENAPWPGLYVSGTLADLPPIDGILFSGGVSEYIYARETRTFGDLGPYLGDEIRQRAQDESFHIIPSGEGIRATVIGASQYTVQLSGETNFVPKSATLPIRNLRVFVVYVDWDAPVAERAGKAVKMTLEMRDPEVCGSPFVLAFSSPPFVGYAAAQELAKGIGQALTALGVENRPKALIFEQNIGRVIGGILSSEWQIPCVDEIQLSELDFIDIGEVVGGESYIPVVVKSLTFGV
jgi:ethanolamine utilization protein EutA